MMGLEDILDAIPNHGMRDSVERYLVHGIPPGGFMIAVLSNSLTEAAGRADATNRELLLEWASWLYNFCPAQAHGSMDKVVKWCESGGLSGKHGLSWTDPAQPTDSPSS